MRHKEEANRTGEGRIKNCKNVRIEFILNRSDEKEKEKEKERKKEEKKRSRKKERKRG